MHDQSFVTEFLYVHNLLGITIVLITFLIIGLFHPLVIKGEYYLGVKSWRIFLIMGIFSALLSVLTNDLLCTSALGIIAFSSFWAIREVFEQRERVRKGWFPQNYKRKRLNIKKVRIFIKTLI